MRKLVSKALKSVGLLGLARASKRHLSSFPRNLQWRIKGDFNSDNGLPLPPPGLSFEVSANYDIEYFLRTGLQGADSIREILLKNNRPISSFENILDFGCGCGRITRHWKDLTRASITGTDINPRLVHWAQKNLGFARFLTNGISDTLPFGDSSFDLIYAISVFTHLDEHLQTHWMNELTRVLKPGGALLITVKGENWKTELNSTQQAAFDEGQMVVLEPENSGSNYCGAYHSREYVGNVLASELEVIQHDPCGSRDTQQDFYLMIK